MAQVEMVVSDPVRLVAIVTRDAVEELGLKNGMTATAIVKSTNVMVQSYDARRALSPRLARRRAARAGRARVAQTRPAHRVRGGVAHRRLPEDRPARALLVRRLEHARGADPAGRARRRLRVGEHDAAEPALCEGALLQARRLHPQHARRSSCRGRTRPASTASTTSRSAGSRSSSPRPACRSGATRCRSSRS